MLWARLARGNRKGVILLAGVVHFAVITGSCALEVHAADEFWDVDDTPAAGANRNSLAWAERCVNSCKHECTSNPPRMSLSCRLLRWDIQDDCAYRCVHSCLAEGIRHGE